jgi:hypothetical protein
MIAGLLIAILWSADVITNVPDISQAPVMTEDVPFTANLVVVNPNQRAVRVERLDSTCTCTQRTMDDTFLLPGGSTTLRITVDNRDRSGPRDIGVTVYLTDPELDPIEVRCWWSVVPQVAVDSLPPEQRDTLQRPENRAWHDIYRLVAHERPDEPQRLRKRVRLESPPALAPAGGLQVLDVTFLDLAGGPGAVWSFTPRRQDDGSWLITGGPATTALVAGETSGRLVITTNHQAKPRIEIQVDTILDSLAGSRTRDPFMGQ